MDKQSEKMERNLKLRYAIKHSIVLMLFLILTIDAVHANPSIKHLLSRLKVSGSRQKSTIDILKIENPQFKIKKSKLNYFYSWDTHPDCIDLHDIVITLNKYTTMKNNISAFDDRVKYNTVTIEGNSFLEFATRYGEQGEMCMRFIRAFGNLQAKTLVISNVSYIDANTSKKTASSKKTDTYTRILDVEKIIFKNVCAEVSLQILTNYRFKGPVEIIFGDANSYSPDFLKQFAALHTYKKVVMHCVDGLYDLNEADKKELKGILSVLVIRKKPEEINVNLHYKLQKRLRKCLSTTKPIKICEYNIVSTEFDLMRGSSKDRKLSLVANCMSDFRPIYFEKYKEGTVTRYRYNYAEIHDEPVEDQYEVIAREANKTGSHYNYTPATCSFDVEIILPETVSLTLPRLKRILQWAAQHVRNATKVTITYYKLCPTSISLFASMRVEVENMQHLQCISLKFMYMFEKNRTVTIRDINCKDQYVTAMTSFDDKKEHTLALPLNLYIHGEVLNRAAGHKKFYPIEYPVSQNADVLTICDRCSLKVFTCQGDTEGSKSTSDVLSLQEIRDMTWNEFSESKNRENIEKHLQIAYDLDRPLVLNKNNFSSAVEYVLTKPIFILNKCLHTVCAGCLQENIQMKRTKTSIFDFSYSGASVVTIQCRECNTLRDLSSNFRYFVRAGNTSNLEAKYVYYAEVSDNKGKETQYILYESLPLKNSKYYFQTLPQLTKPNFIVRKDESKKEVSVVS